MTQEEATYTEPAPFPEAGYLQWSVPGIPYSAVRIPLVYNSGEMNVLIAHAIEASKILLEAYNDEFSTKEQPQEVQRVPVQQPVATRQRQARPAKSAYPDPDLVIKGFCPDHPDVPARLSNETYQEIEMDDEGNERYAKYWCDGKLNGMNRNHSLYARQLVR